MWDKYENVNKLPCFYRDIIEIDFNQFEKKVYSNDKKYSKNIVNSLLAGDVYLLKNTFSLSVDGLIYKVYILVSNCEEFKYIGFVSIFKPVLNLTPF